jgi:hypothetical protein
LELCVVLLLAVGNMAGARERGVPPGEGIGNFGKVDECLFRGAQPDAAGVKNLAKLGVKTIINLRMTNELWRAEASEASATGIICAPQGHWPAVRCPGVNPADPH